MAPRTLLEAPLAKVPTARPGFLLLALAAICMALVFVLPVGFLIILHQNGVLTVEVLSKLGWMSLSILAAIFSPGRSIMLVLAIPTGLIVVFAIAYLIAFFLRATWGPRLLSVLAVIWALSVSASTILVPLLAMPGPLPTLTFLGMIPGLIGPLVFALGFVGFMLHGDVVRAWFGTLPKDTQPTELHA